VKRYIELYTDHFELRKSIRFNTKLLCAKPVDPTGDPPHEFVFILPPSIIARDTGNIS
jgi:hypothetical protein